MIAKDLMPWLFVGRKSAWTPFAKVRCEGGRCVWAARPKSPRARRQAPVKSS
jgi:hypothetical protein